MPDPRVTTYLHRRGRDANFRMVDGFVAAYSRALRPDWSSCSAELLAESLFWTFRVVEDADFAALAEEDQKLNRAYRARRLRPFVVGDVLAIGREGFACGPWGHARRVDLAALNVIHLRAKGATRA